jgi:aldehyde dehydrogenase (NAD+)
MRNNFIGGEWLSSAETIENINPSDLSDLIDLYACADTALVQQAVDAAVAASQSYVELPLQQRADALEFVASELLDRSAEIGTLLSREEGKTLREGVAEVRRAGHIFRFYAGEALRMSGRLGSSVRAGVGVETRYEPLGPVGVITPWNFPIAIPSWKIAAALAYGNTVVFKPSELVCGSAWLLADIFSRTEVPSGTFNLVMGRGPSVGRSLVNASAIRGISFTGSEGVGLEIAVECARRGARVQLEMGGKNPLVVLDDADIEQAVSIAIDGAFHSTGQRCTATGRIIVTDGAFDRFQKLFCEAARRLRVGHALAEETDVGPVVSDVQLEINQRYLGIGKGEGASLTGGDRLSLSHEGYFMTPAVFSEVTNDMKIAREEIFGPVVCLLRVGDYEEALETANDTRYGLSSGICTRSLKHAEHFKRSSNAGLVSVNLPTAGIDYHVPFGGHGASGYGPSELGSEARQFFTRGKTCYTCSG